MLVLARRKGEWIRMDLGGKLVWIQVLEMREGRVRLVFDAPDDVQIMREELLPPEQRRGNQVA